MKRSPPGGVFALAFCIASIWVVGGYLLPAITDSFEITRDLADYIDESGIETGQFYYTGVESTATAEIGARASVAFWEMRRSAAEKEGKANRE